MNKTIKELNIIDEVVGQLYEKDKTLENSKFGYAYKRFFAKNYTPVQKEFQEKILDVRVDNAMEDKNTKEILKDESNPRGRGFKYTKEGLKKCIEAERKLTEDFENQEIEIEPFISSLVPADITDEQKEILTGCIL